MAINVKISTGQRESVKFEVFVHSTLKSFMHLLNPMVNSSSISRKCDPMTAIAYTEWPANVLSVIHDKNNELLETAKCLIITKQLTIVQDGRRTITITATGKMKKVKKFDKTMLFNSYYTAIILRK